MNPAAIRALAEGNIEDFLAAMAPGGIVAQEAAGQKKFTRGDILPRNLKRVTREELEGLGFVFGEDIDALFVECRLPDGWSKQPTEHSLWTDLLDAEGVKRASIFYKAAFYDRDAWVGWVTPPPPTEE